MRTAGDIEVALEPWARHHAGGEQGARGDSTLLQSGLDVDDGVVSAVIIGRAAGFPDVDQLAADLAESLDQEVDVNISLVVEELFRSGG